MQMRDFSKGPKIILSSLKIKYSTRNNIFIIFLRICLLFYVSILNYNTQI